jgi:transposase
VIVRLRYCDATRTYMERRRSEGLSKLDTIRCLKRYLAREVYTAIRHDFEHLKP